MAKFITRLLRSVKKKFGIRKNIKVTLVDSESQTIMVTEDVMIQVECVPQSHNLVSQVEGVKVATSQTSILFSDKFTQTHFIAVFNTSETQTDTFDLTNCGTQTDLLSKNIISKSTAEPHESISQCCILPISNDPHLDTLKEMSLKVDKASTLNWSKSPLEDTQLYSQDDIVDGHNGTQVDNRPKLYMLENLPQLDLANNCSYHMRVLYSQKDYFCMTKVVDEHIVRSMENKMTKCYRQPVFQNFNYKPQINELCATKYGDGRWYRGICRSVEENVNGEETYVINLLDWGESVTVKAGQLRRLKMCFMKNPPLAVKCTILGTIFKNVYKNYLMKSSA
ncbi:uncharacterized protein LOC126900197 [Daktulosphaira vitifoliae]|uniref:uncharacterized protein LOC126900197 n=1 Tax=Daktulosphaira vitifoliae TaxID=58002 RepID=UPI0021AAB25A|nr:uncharacterized protein LOC126900197 [Daktulosphaira vitifoliae]